MQQHTAVSRILVLMILLGLLLPMHAGRASAAPMRDTPVMIDLGTLFDGGFSHAVAINDAGHVVGFSYPYAGSLHGFLWADGAMTDLGALTATMPQDINNQDQVVGYSAASEAPFAEHAFLWQDGVMTDLGSLNPGEASRALRINEAGQVIGYSGSRSFLVENGAMIDLGTLGGTTTSVQDINNAGQIVGVSSLPGGELHPFLWQNGVMTALPTLAGQSSYATDINEAGQIVGSSMTPDGVEHAVLWDHGQLVDLGVGNGKPAIATFINDSGMVTGCIFGYFNPCESTFLWQDGQWTDLGNFGTQHSWPKGINNNGVVVGCYTQSYSIAPLAFAWMNGEGITLGTLGGDYACAMDINELNQVVGDSYVPHPDLPIIHGFLVNLGGITPPTPQEQLAAVIEQVEALEQSGVLNSGQANSLISKLEALTRQLERGNEAAAQHMVRALLNEIEALMKAGVLTTSQGQTLIDAIEAAMSG